MGHRLILAQLPFCFWELQETLNYAKVKRLRSAGGVEWRGVRGGWGGGGEIIMMYIFQVCSREDGNGETDSKLK